MEEQTSTGKSPAGKGKRKGKVFYCFSGVSLFLYTLSSLMLVASILAVVGIFVEQDERVVYNILVFISACVIDVFIILLFVWQYRARIIFEEEKISVKDGLCIAGFKRLQHALTIKYEDIDRVFVTESTRDSLGNSVPYVFVDMKYIVFQLKDGQMNQRLNVYYFSGWQKVKIINEIYTRMGVEYSKEERPGKKLLEDFKVQQKKEWQAAKEQKKAERMAKKQRKAEQKAERKK